MFRNWTGEHWTLLALFMAATGSVLSGLHSWNEALQPAIIGGLLAQFGVAMRAFYTGSPATTKAQIVGDAVGEAIVAAKDKVVENITTKGE